MGTALINELQSSIQRINTIRDKAIAYTNQINSDYIKRELNDDARPAAMRLFLNVLEGTYLSLNIMNTIMDDPTWWERIAGKKLTPDEARPSLKAYYEVMKVSFIQLLVSVLDTSFRRFLKAIKPNACNNATGNFKNIYKCLFKCLDRKSHDDTQLFVKYHPSVV